MALTAECTNELITVTQTNGNKLTFSRDGLFGFYVNFGGLLDPSTLTIKKGYPNSHMEDIVISGTGTECAGLHDAFAAFMRDVFAGEPYEDWTYP